MNGIKIVANVKINKQEILAHILQELPQFGGSDSITNIIRK